LRSGDFCARFIMSCTVLDDAARCGGMVVVTGMKGWMVLF
jgi:hypothetical protein